MPIVKITEAEGYLDLAYHKLVKDGYDTLTGILNLRVDIVARAMRHNNFIADYETQYWELNRIDK